MPYAHSLKSLTLTSSALCLIGGMATADIVHLDDVIVSLSLCVGQDCVNGESFGFDTIRLKENNLRIRAVDTSSTASFPSRDWQITFNDSANGGANKFSIDDIDGGRTPFTIEAGAPSHSLYVDDGGRVGLGTNNPVVDVHVKSGNTPTLRLEQDGSSGFTPQTWDVAGNEANFFVRDATNGSALPFKIKPGAPTSSIFVAADGDIGLGTESPDASLEVETNDAGFVRMLALTNTGAGGISYRLTSNGLHIDTNNTAGVYRINFDDGDNQELELDTDGNLVLDGTLTTSGSCSVGCDRVFSPDYELLSIEEHTDLMFSNRYLPNVGATQEEGPFNLSDKVLRMLNELEQAHIYIAQLNDRIVELESSQPALTKPEPRTLRP